MSNPNPTEIQTPKSANSYHDVFRKLLLDVSKTLELKHNIKISESFVVMMVKLVALDPAKKFVIKQPVIRAEMERLKRTVVEFVTGMTTVQRNIIRMQFHYRGNHFKRDELIGAHRADLEHQVQDWLQELRESVPKQLKENDLYYRKLIAVSITLNDMGVAANPNVVKETEAALSSVFPKEEIGLLGSISNEERERELRQLIKMTAGIRLYNREVESAANGTGIEDVLSILPDKIFRCANLLSEMREINIQRLIRYTTLIKPYFLSMNEAKGSLRNKKGRLDISQDMLWVRQGLVMVHQVLVYIKELSDELTTEDENCEFFTKMYQQAMRELKDAVKDSTSIPTFLVYPKFLVLSESWQGLQDSVTFMDTLIELVDNIMESSESDLSQIDTLVQNIASNSFECIFPDENHFFDFPAEEISDDDMVLAYRTEFKSHMDPLSMMYSGFCVWSLVHGLGLVLLSNPNLGVFNWRDRQFLLANANAAHEFRRDPDLFVYKALFIARRWPELIFLLKVDNQVFNPSVQAEPDRPQTAMNAKVSVDSSVQTELHPVECNLVQGYTWNEWEYRKKAILLQKLSKCSTHSTQTYVQSLKTDSSAQTYKPKNTKSQTMHDKYSEVPMSQFFMWGLRGCHEHPPHVVELIRDCAQCLQCLVPKVKKQASVKKCK